jgi:hypothetical protein
MMNDVAVVDVVVVRLDLSGHWVDSIDYAADVTDDGVIGLNGID